MAYLVARKKLVGAQNNSGALLNMPNIKKIYTASVRNLQVVLPER
jgi:hypothetical protein